MPSSGEEQQSVRENSLLNNISTNSNFGDNFERPSQLFTAENARLIRELEDQKEETRKMRMERDEFKSQLFGLQERYVQSNERLYKEITTPKCSDGKVWNLNVWSKKIVNLKIRKCELINYSKRKNWHPNWMDLTRRFVHKILRKKRFLSSLIYKAHCFASISFRPGGCGSLLAPHPHPIPCPPPEGGGVYVGSKFCGRDQYCKFFAPKKNPHGTSPSKRRRKTKNCLIS